MRDPYKIIDGIDEMKIRVRDDFFKILECYKNPVGLIIRDHRGRYAEKLLVKTNERLSITLLDTYDHPLGRQREAEAISRLGKFGDRAEIVKMGSFGAISRFKDQSLDFIYIDSNESYDSIKAEIDMWWPKAKNGALFAGYNYDVKKKKHVASAVHDFVKEKRQELFFTYEDSATDKEKTRSFYMIKNMAP